MAGWEAWAPSEEETVALLCTLVETASMNPYGPTLPEDPRYGEAAVAERVRQWLAEAGIEAQLSEALPGRPNVVARVPGPPGSPTLLLETHLDTIPAPWLEGPPRARVEGGKVWGLGACDAKGCLTAMLLALRRAAAHGSRATLLLCAAADEEAGFRGVTHFVQQGWRADEAVVGEPTELAMVVAHKGVLRWHIETRGRAAHASTPGLGRSAILDMARVIGRLEADYLPRLRSRRHPLLGEATFNIGRIHGGTQVNVVPDHCLIDVDRRYLPGETEASVLAEVEAILAALRAEHPELQVHCREPYLVSPPLTDAQNAAVSETLARAHAEVLGQAPARVGAPYGTDASKLQVAGIPAVVYGPGSIAQAHRPDEHVEIQAIRQAAAVYARWLVRG